jgi:hypothetical protein
VKQLTLALLLTAPLFSGSASDPCEDQYGAGWAMELSSEGAQADSCMNVTTDPVLYLPMPGGGF